MHVLTFLSLALSFASVYADQSLGSSSTTDLSAASTPTPTTTSPTTNTSAPQVTPTTTTTTTQAAKTHTTSSEPPATTEAPTTSEAQASPTSTTSTSSSIETSSSSTPQTSAAAQAETSSEDSSQSSSTDSDSSSSSSSPSSSSVDDQTSTIKSAAGVTTAQGTATGHTATETTGTAAGGASYYTATPGHAGAATADSSVISATPAPSTSSGGTGFLANKGAMAGTFIAAGFAAIFIIWVFANFIRRRVRRARRDARERQYEEDMAAYEKGGHGVELEQKGGDQDPDASFGNHVLDNDVDDVATMAAPAAYPDRSVHYGYDQNGFANQAYGQEYANQAHGQGYANPAYGQEYANYGYSVDYPPQAGHGYGAHDYQQSQYQSYPAQSQGHNGGYAA